MPKLKKSEYTVEHLCRKHGRARIIQLTSPLFSGIEEHIELDFVDEDPTIICSHSEMKGPSLTPCTKAAKVRILLGPDSDEAYLAFLAKRVIR